PYYLEHVRHRFLASDIAWLASGANEDNQHDPDQRGFFPEFKALRDSLPADDNGYNSHQEFGESVRQLIWDLTTMWDRTFGSTTMILHASGTTIPGMPPRSEFLRTSVYLPLAFLQRHPDSQPAIAQIAQQFIETVGVSTVIAWAEDARAYGWRLTQSGGTFHPNSFADNHVIPTPKPNGSSHYVFRGRAAGFTIPSPANVDITPSSPTSTRYGSEEPLSPEAEALLTAMEQNSLLQSELDLLCGHLDRATDEQLSMIEQLTDAQREAHTLSSELAAARDCEEGYIEQQRQLQGYIGSLQGRASESRTPVSTLRAPQSPRPPTYVSSQLSTPTRARASTPSLASPMKTSADILLPLTTQLLEDQQLTALLNTVRIMIKHIASSKWFQEIAGWGLDDAVAEALLDLLTQDCDL
ncbi:hypothetical protein B0H13DRAFT_1931311, partial [Mycena leptocephala]